MNYVASVSPREVKVYTVSFDPALKYTQAPDIKQNRQTWRQAERSVRLLVTSFVYREQNLSFHDTSLACYLITFLLHYVLHAITLAPRFIYNMHTTVLHNASSIRT